MNAIKLTSKAMIASVVISLLCSSAYGMCGLYVPNYLMEINQKMKTISEVMVEMGLIQENTIDPKTIKSTNQNGKRLQ